MARKRTAAESKSTAKSKPATKSRAAKIRSSWQGNLSFGLVAFAVEAVNAQNSQQNSIQFHQIHSTCHRRIRYVKTCPVHGEVPNEEIESAYEQESGEYVAIDRGEVKALKSSKERALSIEAFVPYDAIDPLYFDGRMYYLQPATASAEVPYGVIMAAMEREGVCAVGQIVFSGKDQLVLLRPLEGVLHMVMLHYAAEMRAPSEFAEQFARPSGQSQHIKLAQTLINELYDENFDFSAYNDPWREQLEALIEAKAKGIELPPEEAGETPATINLMEALKRSLKQSKPAPSTKRGSRKTETA